MEILNGMERSCRDGLEVCLLCFTKVKLTTNCFNPLSNIAPWCEYLNEQHAVSLGMSLAD